MFSAFPSQNSAKIKKRLLNKDLILGTTVKICSKDTAKDVTVKYELVICESSHNTHFCQLKVVGFGLQLDCGFYRDRMQQ